MIREVEVILRYDDHSKRTLFAVTKLSGRTTLLGYTWLCKHNPQIDWQNKTITMSRCLQQCLTCQTDARNERKMSHAFEARINTCQSGLFPTLVEEYDDDEDDDDRDAPARR